MLVLALLLVNVLRAAGVIELLEAALAPLFTLLDLPTAALLSVITKYIAGGTAMMGIMMDSLEQGLVSVDEFNRLAGFLIHPLDVAGVALMISAGKRVAEVLKPALYGAVVAIAIRTVLHYIWF
jgi:spore maturation protein SpmB